MHRTTYLTLLALCLGCADDEPKTTTTTTTTDDADNDGVPADDDCDDTDDAVHPDATEICNGIDDDCDGRIDDADDDLDPATTPDWVPDLDGDGYPGEITTPVSACVAPDNYIEPRADGLLDCEDLDVETYPGSPFDPPYDGIDGDCAGDNDFDPDGDGFMPPQLPAGGSTQTAYETYLSRYDLAFSLPSPVIVSAAGEPVQELGPFDDCLDLRDPRSGASDLDAANIYPRAWSESFGDSGDVPYDGVDTDCNRDNDFDQDRDGYNRLGDDLAYDEYVAFWDYASLEEEWVDGTGRTGPAPGDCEDTDPSVHPNALERPGTPTLDEDCDGSTDSASFAYAGAPSAPVMEWRGLGEPRVNRLGNVYGVILGAHELNQPGLGSPLSQNVGLVLSFPLDDATGNARPATPPYSWKGQSATQELGAAMDVVSLDRCPDEDGDAIAYVSIEYETVGAPSVFFSVYPLQEDASGQQIYAPGLDTIGSLIGSGASSAVSLNMDGACETVLAGIRADDMYVAHGTGQVVDLSLLQEETLSGTTIAAAFSPADAAGASPFVSFDVCDDVSCSEHTFDLDPTTASDPVLVDSVLETGPWRSTRSTWSKDDSAMTVSIPLSGPGLEVVATPVGAASTTTTVLDTDTVWAAQGQVHDGEYYIAAILGGGDVVLVHGVPGSMETFALNWTERLPTAATSAAPKDVALFVDDDRIAVALTLEDASAGPEELNDALGWVFLGLPN